MRCRKKQQRQHQDRSGYCRPHYCSSRLLTTVRCLLTTLLKGSFPSILCFLAEGISNKLCFIRHGFPWFFLVWTNISAHASPTFFHGRMYVAVFRLQASIARYTSSKDIQYVYRTRVCFAIDFISTVLTPISNQVRLQARGRYRVYVQSVAQAGSNTVPRCL